MCTGAHHRHAACALGLVEAVGADGLDQLASVNLHGALLLTHAVRSAGRLALVLVALAQVLQPAPKATLSAFSVWPSQGEKLEVVYSVTEYRSQS